MELFTKNISPKGKVSYAPYNPAVMPDMQVEPEQVVAIFSALSISMLISLSDQLPKHSKIARELDLLSNAIARFGKVTGEPLNPDYIETGVLAWNAATQAVQIGLLRQGAA